MFKKVVLAASLALATGCTTVPITGRRTLNLVSDSEMNTLAVTQYKQTLGTAKLSTNAEQTAMVRRVGQRIAAAVQQPVLRHTTPQPLHGFDRVGGEPRCRVEELHGERQLHRVRGAAGVGVPAVPFSYLS